MKWSKYEKVDKIKGGKASKLQALIKVTRNDQVRFECSNNPNYCQKLPGVLMTSNVP